MFVLKKLQLNFSANVLRYYSYYSERGIRMDAEPNAMIYADGLKQLLNDKSEASYHCNLMQHPIISIDKFLIQFIEVSRIVIFCPVPNSFVPSSI